jgi:hypothetical protein
MSKENRPFVRALLTVMAVLAAGIGGVAYASDTFPDVPNGGFHDQIDAIVNAGCATGFNDGTFRPTDGTKRGQFAFWMNNCGSRIYGAGTFGPTNIFDADTNDGFRNGPVEVLSDQVTVAGSGSQMASSLATVSLVENSTFATYCASASCRLWAILYIDGVFLVEQEVRFTSDHAGQTATVQGVKLLAAGTHTVSVQVDVVGVKSDSPVVAGQTRLTSHVAPF